MRRAILFLAVIVITCPWLLAATYPQLVVGGGYECVIIIANPRATGFTGRLELRKGNGVLWNTPFTVNDQAYSGSSVPITLAPFATGKFVLRSNTLQIGYLDLLGREGSNGSDVAVSFFYNFLSGGTLVESTGIPNSSISRGHVFGVEHSSRVNTALAWCSFYPTDPFDITLTLYDAAGVQVQQKVYPYTGHLPRYFTELFDNVPAEFVGHVRMYSTPGLGLTVLRFEQVGNAFHLTSTPSKTFEVTP